MKREQADNTASSLISGTRRALVSWWCIYAVASLIEIFLFRSSYDTVVCLFDAGVLLSALLHFKAIRLPASSGAVFIIVAFAFDIWLKITWLQFQPIQAVTISTLIVLQVIIAFYLLNRFAHSAWLPDTQVKVIRFTLYAALVPALIAGCFYALVGPLMFGTELTITALTWAFLFWLVIGFNAVLIVTPCMVFILHDRGKEQRGSFFTECKQWSGVVLAITLVAALIFSFANPAGRQLATYSYLLLPLVVFMAMRIPLSQSLMAGVLISIVCFAGDGQSAGDGEQAFRSLLTLSIFLSINVGLILLLGVMMRERKLSFAKEHQQRNLYEIFSRVNKLLVRDDLTEHQLFAQVCQLIAEKGVFEQVCITSVSKINPPAGWRSTCFSRGENGTLAIMRHNDDCCYLVQKAIEQHRPLFFSDCRVCPEYENCPIQSASNASMAVFPITKGAEIVAVLSVFSTTSAIDEDIWCLLQDLAAELGFATTMYERREYLNQIAEVFTHSKESILITDAKGTILNVNPGFSQVTGYSAGEVIGKNPRILKSGKQADEFYQKLFKDLKCNGVWTGEFWNKRKNGELYLQRGTISCVRNDAGEELHFIAIMEDVTQQLKAEETIKHLAHFDHLTGLANRIQLDNRFTFVAASVSQDIQAWALLFVDLDEFKQVNDALGHRYGDKLLKEVAARLSCHVRENDVLCRFGGDEFIVLMKGEREQAALLARRLIDAIGQPFNIDNSPIKISASIGISMLPRDGETLDVLIQAADTAMYQAKARGRNRHEFFAEQMQISAQLNLDIKQRLDNAIENNEFSLHYQAKFCCNEEGTTKVGYEALIRWNHPDQGYVAPSVFIPVAERTGQIASIDMWVINEVIARLMALRQANSSCAPLPIAVNLSASSFSRPGFAKTLDDMLIAADIPTNWLELELTEHAIMTDMEYSFRTMSVLKKLGVKVTLDDFGTGYSSLSYLQQLPIDTLKIDLSFIRNIHQDLKKQGIVKAIINLAHSLELKTVAEGVECEDELLFLQQIHCDEYQGYYFSKPTPAIF